MRLSPKDIAKYIYCPYLKYINKTNYILDNEFTIFEKCIIETIKQTESHCAIYNTRLYPRKFIKEWDKIWWPASAAKGINPKEAQKFSVKAAAIFTDYCKYDISSEQFPTVGINIPSEKLINNSILAAKADILKVNLGLKNKNIHLITFGNVSKTKLEIGLDPELRTLLYCFFSGEEITLTCSYIKISQKINKILVSSVVLRQDEMKDIENMIFHIKTGIRKQIKYQNIHNCKECQVCQSK